MRSLCGFIACACLVVAPSVRAAGPTAQPASAPASAPAASAPAREPGASRPASAPIYETVVRAPRPMEWVSGSQLRIDAGLLRSAPARSSDELLRLIPAALVVQHGTEGKGHQLFLRGFDAAHGSDVEVRLEGIPLNESSNVHGHGYLDLAFIPTEVVRRLKVVKGPFDVGQGNFATAGSVRFELGPTERGELVRYTVGSSNRHQLDLVHTPRSASRAFLALQALHDDGFGDNRRAQRLSGIARMPLVRGLTRGIGRVELLALGYAATFGLPGTLRLEDVQRRALGFYDSYLGEMGGESQRAIFALTQKRAFRRGLLRSTFYGQWRGLELRENYTGYLVDPENGDRRRQSQKTLGAGAVISAKYRFRGGLGLRAGAEWRGDWGAQREEQLAMDEDRVLELRRDLGYQQNEAAFFSELSWRPHPTLRLRAGARAMLFHYRLDLPQVREDALATVVPRASLVWRAQRWLTLFGSYGHGLRAPEARAFDVRPESSDVELARNQPGEARITLSRNAEAGVHLLASSKVELRATGFATFIDRESIFDHVAGTNLERNGTRRLGGELLLSLRPWRWFELRADAALVDARFSGSGAVVPGAPRSIGSVGIRLRRRRLRAALRLLWLGPRPLAHGAEAASAAIAQLTAGWRWRWLELGLQVDNLFDTRWREAESHFASFWDRTASRSSLPVLHYVAGPPLTALVSLGVRL